MSLIESRNFELGTKAFNFRLQNTIDEKYYDLDFLKGEKGTAIFFICNHCPFVIHINRELVRMANEYSIKGINFIAISSNDTYYAPQDGPTYMKKVAEKFGYPFPYLYDESQEVAKLYNAVCTPDLYLFDNDLKSVYHGQLDDSRPGNGIPVNGQDFRNAMNLLLKNEKNTSQAKPSIGCSIKWK